MASRIAIIGAGWYGCHIGLSLKNLGFDVTIFERHDRPLHQASGNNQFRLHMGFHYPRHHITRTQSKEGYTRFMERYPTLSQPVVENIYAVPKTNSLLDFITYRMIMTATGLDFKETDYASIPIEDISGLLLTDERVILTARAREYFITHLGGDLVLSHAVTHIHEGSTHITVEGETYDFLIDATWGAVHKIPAPVIYEPTILLYYENITNYPACTFVDGPLCSIYPTENPTIYTLSSVIHTPLGHTATPEEAFAIRDRVSRTTVMSKVALMEEEISHFLPGFKEHMRFVMPQLAVKTKPVGFFDDRSCSVYKNGRVISVMSGKIDTIFFAMERILAFITSHPEKSTAARPSPHKQANDLILH